MPDINLTSVAGKGVSFQTEGIVGGTISSGQTGVLLSLSEVEGKTYRIKLLVAATGSQSGISLITNGNTIESEKALASTNASTDTQFNIIKNRFNESSPSSVAFTYDEVECKSFSLEKNAGNTSVAIDYSYEIGEYK